MIQTIKLNIPKELSAVSETSNKNKIFLENVKYSDIKH